jgi:hypothetical protein
VLPQAADLSRDRVPGDRSAPAPLTQLARFNDFHVQVTLHATDYAGLLSAARLRAAALEAMAEYVTL